MEDQEETPSVSDDSIEIGQATLATLHLTNILKGAMPRIGIAWQKKIIGIDKTIDGLARQLVADELSGRLTIPRPFVYRKAFERFTKPLSELETKQIMSKFPRDATDTALAFKSALQSAYDHVADMLPVSEIATYLGPKQIMPTSDKLYDFWVDYLFVDDPLKAFQWIQMGAITPDQVTTIKEFYPSLYNYMKVSILNALTERKMREPSFTNLPPRADRGLGVFKQMRVVDYGPNIHAVPDNKPKVASAQPPKLNKGLQTQAQQSDNVAV